MTAIKSYATAKSETAAGIAAAIRSDIASSPASIQTSEGHKMHTKISGPITDKTSDDDLIQLISSPTGFGGEHAAIAIAADGIDAIDTSIGAPIASAAIAADAAASQIRIAGDIVIEDGIEIDAEAIAGEPIAIAGPIGKASIGGSIGGGGRILI